MMQLLVINNNIIIINQARVIILCVPVTSPIMTLHGLMVCFGEVTVHAMYMYMLHACHMQPYFGFWDGEFNKCT